MQVKSIYNNNELIQESNTKHIEDRPDRLKAYKHLLSKEFLQCFRVDNNHYNGDEIHCINNKGLIYIYNYNSYRLITLLHPRPKQIKRYYYSLNLKIPNNIKKLIDENYKRNNNDNFNNSSCCKSDRIFFECLKNY